MKTRSQRWTEWMIAARDGDERAFDRLAEEAQPEVRRRAMEKLQDASLADEVASRALINAWKARASYDPQRANARTWIHTIADRLTIDLLEQRAGQQSRTATGFDPVGSGEDGEAPVRVEPEDDVELAPPEEAEQPLLAAVVRDALATLSDSDRAILQLFYYDQLGYEEIATRLGVGVKAVGPRLTRARQRLQERLPPEALG
jgi:RNA polymerase sigma-70 factor (ECF subfamily)